MKLDRFGLGIHAPAAGRAGDPGLFGPDSLVWRIARERVLLASGPAALLLQIAHPLVAEAVARHSEFRRDPFGRLRATLGATLTISFGDTEQVRAAAADVVARHRTVRGRLVAASGGFAAGAPYDALDPALGLWVHTTLVWMGLDAYHQLVSPLSDLEQAGYYQESKRFAHQVGVPEDVLPASHRDFLDYRDAMLECSAIEVGDVARALAKDIVHPPLPVPIGPGIVPLTVLTAGLLPEGVRRGFGMSWGIPERAGFRAVAASLRAAVKVMPPALRYWPHYRTAVRRVGALKP